MSWVGGPNSVLARRAGGPVGPFPAAAELGMLMAGPHTGTVIGGSSWAPARERTALYGELRCRCGGLWAGRPDVLLVDDPRRIHRGRVRRERGHRAQAEGGAYR